MESEYLEIDPLVDFAFKVLFGRPENKELTIHLLNATLTDQPGIVDVEFQSPILEKETEEDKYSIVDILAKDDQGRKFHIEMQRVPH